MLGVNLCGSLVADPGVASAAATGTGGAGDDCAICADCCCACVLPGWAACWYCLLEPGPSVVLAAPAAAIAAAVPAAAVLDTGSCVVTLS